MEETQALHGKTKYKSEECKEGNDDYRNPFATSYLQAGKLCGRKDANLLRDLVALIKLHFFFWS